jgi:hypothetical protein
MATHQLPRRPGDQTFRKNDLRRAIATASAMKLPLKGIVVNRDGFELVVGDSEPTTTTETTKELDQWMEKKKKS